LWQSSAWLGLDKLHAVGVWKRKPELGSKYGDSLIRVHVSSTVEFGALAAMSFSGNRRVGLGVSYGPLRLQRKFAYTLFIDM